MNNASTISSADSSGRLATSPIPLTMEDTKSLSPYITPTPGFIPVIVYGNIANNPTGTSANLFNILISNGVNLPAPSVYYSDADNSVAAQIQKVTNALYMAADKKVRLMVRWKDYFSSNVNDYKDFWSGISGSEDGNATVGGWLLDIGGGVQNIANLGKIKGYIKDAYDRVVYISMKTSKSYTDSTSTDKPFEWSGGYKTYMNSVLKSFHPAIWVNRFEAFHTDLDDSSIRSGYFQNLEMFRRLAYSTNRPWYGTIKGSYDSSAQSGFGGSDLTTDRINTIALRYNFEMKTMLAFGAQGLAWENFFAPGTIGKNDWAPVNKLGAANRNLIVHFRSINNQISMLSNVFLGGSVRECRFSRASTYSNGFTVGLSTPLGFLTSISENTSTRGFLLSHIINMGQEYIIVMNFHPISIREATLTFSKEVFIEYDPSNRTGKKKTDTISLNPGDWIIYRNPLCPEPDLED